jgi:hypothetical protein
MVLTAKQQILLLNEYAPILFFHPEERFVPIRPDVFMLQSALWRGNATGTKEGWGLGGANYPNFPRNPVIPRLGISLNPAEDVEGKSDPDGDGVNEYYLGHTNSKTGIKPYLRSVDSERIWLDCAGWRDGDAVTTESANEACNLDELAKRFGPESTLLNTRYTFFGEVLELNDLQRLLISFAGGPASVTDLIRKELGDVWLIWYYFFYPAHEEFLRRCEAFFDKKSDGDYEGDWNAIGLVIPKPLTLPWETPNPTFPDPARVAYGVRLRGLAKDVADSEHLKQGMTMKAWKDVEHTGHHPRIYVARGYHNNYVAPGEHIPRDPTELSVELGKLACGVGEGASQLLADVKDTVKDAGETLKDVALTLVKIFAGAALGASFGNPLAGALSGLAAGLAEANASSADHAPSADDWRKREIEHCPKRGQYGLVITPEDVPEPLISDPDPLKNETAMQIVQWVGDDATRLVDRNTQLWWFPNYEGFWGVQVQKDPMLRRSGIRLPDFQRSLLRELVESIAKGE